MAKKHFISLGLIAALTLTTQMAFADFGSWHFGRGGYSGVRNLQMQGAQAAAVNDSVVKIKGKKAEQEAVLQETTENIEEQEAVLTETSGETEKTKIVPASSYQEPYSFDKNKTIKPAPNPYGFAETNLPAGVNDSKTIYTDNLGRMHFFGRENIIRENAAQE